MMKMRKRTIAAAAADVERVMIGDSPAGACLRSFIVVTETQLDKRSQYRPNLT